MKNISKILIGIAFFISFHLKSELLDTFTFKSQEAKNHLKNIINRKNVHETEIFLRNLNS